MTPHDCNETTGGNMTPIFGLRNLRGLKNTAVDQMKLSWTKKIQNTTVEHKKHKRPQDTI